MLRLTCVIATVGLILLAQARAEEDMGSAGHLLPACHLAASGAASELYLQGICVGQVEGVLDTAQAAGTVCPPRGASNGLAVAEVVRYIDAHTARKNERFTALALSALKAVWPCDRS
jgi:Ssp1 endopeptidase immunity protein Rap1a